ncbi:uncharacterized protein VNE69_09010 [Vairimorpha necatrix]|uniref:Uncharacterized protein n=1 Tax=Vairimorpha necatrix TaxID=6039 RepID=A0AAX4JEL0_9MICR
MKLTNMLNLIFSLGIIKSKIKDEKKKDDKTKDVKKKSNIVENLFMDIKKLSTEIEKLKFMDDEKNPN